MGPSFARATRGIGRSSRGFMHQTGPLAACQGVMSVDRSAEIQFLQSAMIGTR